MHSVNVIFLLSDTALNCLVSCIFSLIYTNVMFIYLITYLKSPIAKCYFSGSLGFGLDTSFYGQQFMLFSSGPFMPASQSGNNNAVPLCCCISIMFNQSINY